MSHPMKLLITGGAGFIGSAVVRGAIPAGTDAFVSAPHPRQNLRLEPTIQSAISELRVINLDSLELCSGESAFVALPPFSERHEFVKSDITDLSELHSVFRTYDPDAVMHLAAETHVDHSISRPLDFIETNVIGTLNLLQASLEHWLQRGSPKNFRFLHVSTDEVFGMLGSSGRFTEDSRYDPRNPYSASKAASDHLVRTWHETYGLPVLISNCSNNFGPFQFPDKLIPKTVACALDGRPIPIFGAGNQIRDWIHVSDHAAALFIILEQGRVGQSYNVGAENERTNLGVVRQVCRILDRIHPSGTPHHRLIKFVADRPGHDTRYAIDPTRMRGELNWRPKIGFEAGLEATVEWYVNNQSWWRPLLPPSDEPSTAVA